MVPIFRGARGRLLPRQSQYRFRQVVAATGIERPVTVDSLRHTLATRLREREGRPEAGAAVLGHRQIATTEVYATRRERRLTTGVGRAVDNRSDGLIPSPRTTPLTVRSQRHRLALAGRAR